MRSPSDEELLGMTGPGADEAFGQLYERWEQPVLAYFVRRVRDPELAADLTAETFAQALASRHRFRPSRGTAPSWLFGIAHHLLSRSLRRGSVEDRGRLRLGVTPISLDDTTLEAVQALAGDAAVEAALQTLPLEQRDAVRARILDGEAYDDIAARLVCSPQAVRQRVSRGLADLRTRIEEPT